MGEARQTVLNRGPFDELFVSRLRTLGIVLSVLLLWNGVSDLIYAYSPAMSGPDYFSSRIISVIGTAGGRSHWAVMAAQTAGWFYPFYAIVYYLWWFGMRRAGFWLSAVPAGLLAYATLMMAGTVQTGTAYLSVLSQAKAVAGSTDPVFYATAGRFIVQQFVRANLTAFSALALGTLWHAVALLTGRTAFPRWFVLFSPLVVLAVTAAVGLLLPAPVAGFVLAPIPTWFMLFPTVAVTGWLARTVRRGAPVDSAP